jgi:hypothetical protein
MATLTAGQSAEVTLDPFASVALVVSGTATIAFSSDAPGLRSGFTVTNAKTQTYGPYGVPMTATITAVDQSVTYTVTGGVAMLSVNDAGDDVLLGTAGAVLAVSEVTAYVNLTATGTAFTGACEFAGYICTVAAGNITVYDNTSAAGTVIVPTTALAVGAFPVFGAGTNGRMALTTGCHVVLSGAATVNVLVQ